ncbi:ferredoxin-type protein NapF [Oceanisphaera litoralis]|uniref:ferredoxin-type protein NapF n=1 Tax=Oceanisphaera litoralis TaxID=225144 RepID=UPI00195A07F2|nr:ferredoxin-type protein NapF [Oceanisphaera litoralis]MBM7457252.1 ferredoxin-type protein NapF [Oceanisphaera litoralis]
MSYSRINLSRRQLFTRQSLTDAPSLPWVKEAQFTDLCTQCGECIKQCPIHIIRPSDGGFPRVDFELGECTFCYLCAEACPEPLFMPKTEPAWHARAVIEEGCLAQQNIDCRSCGDCCEPFAIRFKLAVGAVAQPQIDMAACTGCGACVAVCPTSAISIKNRLQESADVTE